MLAIYRSMEVRVPQALQQIKEVEDIASSTDLTYILEWLIILIFKKCCKVHSGQEVLRAMVFIEQMKKHEWPYNNDAIREIEGLLSQSELEN